MGCRIPFTSSSYVRLILGLRVYRANVFGFGVVRNKSLGYLRPLQESRRAICFLLQET